jgi:hypothetical protein
MNLLSVLWGLCTRVLRSVRPSAPQVCVPVLLASATLPWVASLPAYASTSDVPGQPVAFGAAQYYGSAPAHLNQPIVAMASTADGHGYWLVASDGGVFSFGDAAFYGSTGAMHLNEPIVAMASTADGHGYWLVASDGGVFSFGDAQFSGSMGGTRLNAPVAGIAAAPHGGYWLVAEDGGVFSFGGAVFYGSLGGGQLPVPISSIVGARGLSGYWLLPTEHAAPVASPTLQLGATGPAVLSLQETLSSLGYWNDTPDGSFGDATQQAVYALQKAAGISADGVVGPSTWAALDAGVRPVPQSTSGYVIEVDLQRDLVMFVTNGSLDYVLNTSTGGGYTYTEGGVTQVADTPVGHFDIYRAVDGLVVDSLGALWRPRFFTGGYAIHGDSFVPPYPVSHGCVRVSNEAIDWIWANNLAPIGTAFWVY